eukprot:scaffold3978_cov99-Cylindrotheca_fusiformis.AAC.2
MDQAINSQLGSSHQMHSSGNIAGPTEKRSDKPTRRRSHRPRGCRGGSNRRKNKNGEPRNKNVVNTLSKRGTAKKQESFKTSRPASDKYPTNAKNQWASTGNALPATQCNAAQSFYSNTPQLDFSDMISTTGLNSNSDLSSHASTDDINPSFSQSSSSDENNANHTTLCVSRETEKEQILPPLPSVAFQNVEPATPRGPNPYALQPSAQLNIFPGQHSPFGMAYPQHSQKNRVSIHTANADITPGLVVFQPYSGPDHKSQHLLQQRQTGGSLFCTSPRSFLMGKKTIINRSM